MGDEKHGTAHRNLEAEGFEELREGFEEAASVETNEEDDCAASFSLFRVGDAFIRSSSIVSGCLRLFCTTNVTTRHNWDIATNELTLLTDCDMSSDSSKSKVRAGAEVS